MNEITREELQRIDGIRREADARWGSRGPDVLEMARREDPSLSWGEYALEEAAEALGLPPEGLCAECAYPTGSPVAMCTCGSRVGGRR